MMARYWCGWFWSVCPLQRKTGPWPSSGEQWKLRLHSDSPWPEGMHSRMVPMTFSSYLLKKKKQSDILKVELIKNYITFCLYIFIYCLFVYVWCVYRGQRKTCGNQFSPSTKWVLEIKFRFSGLEEKAFTCWAIFMTLKTQSLPPRDYNIIISFRSSLSFLQTFHLSLLALFQIHNFFILNWHYMHICMCV